MDNNARVGSPKFLRQCNLALTKSYVVDLLIMDLGVFEFDDQQATLVEVAPGATLDEI